MSRPLRLAVLPLWRPVPGVSWMISQKLNSELLNPKKEALFEEERAIPSLKVKMDGWKTILSFWDGPFSRDI